MAGKVRAMQRLARMAVHVIRGIGMARGRFHQWPMHAQHQAVEAWAQGFLRTAGIRLQVEGTPIAHGPVLWVANHQSWLDIPTLHAARFCRFLSKAEIAGWPVVGALARAAGTLFLERSSRRQTQQTVQAMAQALQRGDCLAVFPEGTVGNGRELLPFHGNTLQAAIDADAPIQPVALTFVDARTGQPSFVPCEAWLDEPMVRSLWRTLKTDDLVAVVRYGVPEKAEGRDRRTWARDLQASVERLRAMPAANLATHTP